MSTTPTPPTTASNKLPAWLAQRTRHIGCLSYSASKLRIVFVATCLLLLGYIVVSTFNEPDLASQASQGLDGPGWYKYAVPRPTRPKPKPSGLRSKLSSIHASISERLGLGSHSAADPGSGEANYRTNGGIFSAYEKFNSTASSISVDEEISSGLDIDRLLLGEKRRIGKCSMIFGNHPIYERAIQTHELHDRIHGYPLHVLRHNLFEDVWSKPGYILHLLLRELSKPEEERLDWLMWVDADTILLNPRVPIETFLPPSPEFDDIHLIYTLDWNGLNNGVFPIRVNQWSVDLFAAIVSYRHYRPDADLTFRDQSAMKELLKAPRFKKHSITVPQRWFNAYLEESDGTVKQFQARRGDFLIHFAGMPGREERMTFWLDRAEQHLPDWELDVSQTSYPAEIKAFWEKARKAREQDVTEAKSAVDEAKSVLSRLGESMREFGARLTVDQSDAIRAKEAALKAASKDDDLNAVEPGAVRAAIDALGKASNAPSSEALSLTQNRSRNRSKSSLRKQKPRYSRPPTMQSLQPTAYYCRRLRASRLPRST